MITFGLTTSEISTLLHYQTSNITCTAWLKNRFFRRKD